MCRCVQVKVCVCIGVQVKVCVCIGVQVKVCVCRCVFCTVHVVHCTKDKTLTVTLWCNALRSLHLCLHSDCINRTNRTASCSCNCTVNALHVVTTPLKQHAFTARSNYTVVATR